MSRSINSDKSWNSTDEEYEDLCDNSSANHPAISRRISGDDIPGGCITTHSVSSVIRPGCKMPRTDPLQFVKIQNNELCKKAVEQIKLAEEVKITKEKIKEVEEEWQNNLLSWKSKRRQSKNSSEDESGTSLASNRKTKTFSEILNEKAKSGHRIGYNLHKYIDGELENENEIRFDFNDRNYDSKYADKDSDDNDMNGDNDCDEEIDNKININNNNNIINANNSNNDRSNSLGDVIVFDTSLLEEFSHNHKRQDSSEDSSIVDITNNCQQFAEQKTNSLKTTSVEKQNDISFNSNENCYDFEEDINDRIDDNREIEDILRPDRIKVEIKDWKQENSQRDNVLLYLLKQEQHNQQNQNQSKHFVEDMNHHNSSYDAEDDEEDDEELERLRLEQEKSFRAKLSVFESLAKQDSALDINSVNINRNNSKPKVKDESKRQPPAREDLIQSEQQMKERPVVGIYGAGSYNNCEDSEEVMNARIQQLHIERQKAQRPAPIGLNGQPPEPQPLPPNVIYQSHNFNQNPPVPSAQTQQRSQYEQQQYYLMDEPIAKQNQTTVRSPQPIRPQPTIQTVHKQPTQLSYKPAVQQQPQEHLYVNQKQLFSNQNPNPNQYYEPIESHQRYGSEYYDPTYDSSQQLLQQIQQPIAQPIPQPIPQPIAQPLAQPIAQPIPKQSQQSEQNGGQQSQLSQQIGNEANYTSPHNQYLYYPKPYASKQTKQIPVQKPVVSTQQKQPPTQRPVQQTGAKPTKPQPSVKPQQHSGYNQNHWLLQEAELRRQLASIPAQTSIPSTVSATQRPTTTASVHKSSPTPQKGMLSVSGKKKCSSCGDELGRGCAAMVVESLSLYYHINCFRCSVCNIQLGNGTVGTDVRVRNHKLHCQNCYSNDEAGLKFSRV